MLPIDGVRYPESTVMRNIEKKHRLVKDGKVLAIAYTAEMAEETRKRWALFGLHVEVQSPKRCRS